MSPKTREVPGAPRVEIIGIRGIPEIKAGDDVAEHIVKAANTQGTPISSGDILVVTQKVVSKAEGRVVDLRNVEPSTRATRIANESGKDPRLVDLILRESRRIVRMAPDRGVIITETRHGFVCANAGIDASNVPGEGMVSLLPEDPDASAQRIRQRIAQVLARTKVAVIISDTFGRAWREGHVDFAIGVAGLKPLLDYRGTVDASGKELRITTMAVADELAAAAELVTAKADNVPAAIVRGYRHAEGPDGASALLRERSKDLFR